MTSPSPDDKAETVADLMWNGLDVGPHELAVLAETRRRDPELAMQIADQYARQSNQSQSMKQGRKAS